MTAPVLIAGVQPTLRELRPVTGVWPALRWWLNAPLMWLVACMAAALVVMAKNPMAEAAVYWMVGLWVAAVYGAIVLGLVVLRRGQALLRRTPTGALALDWRLDEAGLSFSNPLAETRLAWEGVVAIREEADRIVFAITPYANQVLPRRVMDEAQARDLAALIAEVRASGRLGRVAG